MNKEEKLNERYPFQFYTFSNISMLEQNGFNFDDYSFNLQHEHELYIGNINGLICRYDIDNPLRLLRYLKQEPDTMIKRKLTFLLPENYYETIGNLKGFRKNVIKVFELPIFKERINILTYKVDNSDIMEKIEELKNMPKFDVAIMNPPYEGELHVKILSKVINYSKITVNISPNIFYNYRKKYDLKPNELYDYDYKTSCDIFGGIQLQCPLAITVYNNKNKFADLSKFTPKLYTIFENKIKPSKTFKNVNILNYDNNGYFVPLKLMTATWDKNKNIIGFTTSNYTI